MVTSPFTSMARARPMTDHARARMAGRGSNLQDDASERFGVLVGWTSQDLGSRMMLAVQTHERDTWAHKDAPAVTRIMMTKSQAAVLANYLMRISGSTPPPRKRGWLASLFG